MLRLLLSYIVVLVLIENSDGYLNSQFNGAETIIFEQQYEIVKWIVHGYRTCI